MEADSRGATASDQARQAFRAGLRARAARTVEGGVAPGPAGNRAHPSRKQTSDRAFAGECNVEQLPDASSISQELHFLALPQHHQRKRVLRAADLIEHDNPRGGPGQRSPCYPRGDATRPPAVGTLDPALVSGSEYFFS